MPIPLQPLQPWSSIPQRQSYNANVPSPSVRVGSYTSGQSAYRSALQQLLDDLERQRNAITFQSYAAQQPANRFEGEMQKAQKTNAANTAAMEAMGIEDTREASENPIARTLLSPIRGFSILASLLPSLAAYNTARWGNRAAQEKVKELTGVDTQEGNYLGTLGQVMLQNAKKAYDFGNTLNTGDFLTAGLGIEAPKNKPGLGWEDPARVARGTAVFIGDVFQDPLSWWTGGFGKGARSVVPAIGKAAASHADDLALAAGKVAASQADELASAGIQKAFAKMAREAAQTQYNARGLETVESILRRAFGDKFDEMAELAAKRGAPWTDDILKTPYEAAKQNKSTLNQIVNMAERGAKDYSAGIEVPFLGKRLYTFKGGASTELQNQFQQLRRFRRGLSWVNKITKTGQLRNFTGSEIEAEALRTAIRNVEAGYGWSEAVRNRDEEAIYNFIIERLGVSRDEAEEIAITAGFVSQRLRHMKPTGAGMGVKQKLVTEPFAGVDETPIRNINQTLFGRTNEEMPTVGAVLDDFYRQNRTVEGRRFPNFRFERDEAGNLIPGRKFTRQVVEEMPNGTTRARNLYTSNMSPEEFANRGTQMFGGKRPFSEVYKEELVRPRIGSVTETPEQVEARLMANAAEMNAERNLPIFSMDYMRGWRQLTEAELEGLDETVTGAAKQKVASGLRPMPKIVREGVDPKKVAKQYIEDPERFGIITLGDRKGRVVGALMYDADTKTVYRTVRDVRTPIKQGVEDTGARIDILAKDVENARDFWDIANAYGSDKVQPTIDRGEWLKSIQRSEARIAAQGREALEQETRVWTPKPRKISDNEYIVAHTGRYYEGNVARRAKDAKGNIIEGAYNIAEKDAQKTIRLVKRGNTWRYEIVDSAKGGKVLERNMVYRKRGDALADFDRMIRRVAKDQKNPFRETVLEVPSRPVKGAGIKPESAKAKFVKSTGGYKRFEELVSEAAEAERSPADFDTYDDYLKTIDQRFSAPKAPTKEEAGVVRIMDTPRVVKSGDGDTIISVPVKEAGKKGRNIYFAVDETGETYTLRRVNRYNSGGGKVRFKDAPEAEQYESINDLYSAYGRNRNPLKNATVSEYRAVAAENPIVPFVNRIDQDDEQAQVFVDWLVSGKKRQMQSVGSKAVPYLEGGYERLGGPGYVAENVDELDIALSREAEESLEELRKQVDELKAAGRTEEAAQVEDFITNQMNRIYNQQGQKQNLEGLAMLDRVLRAEGRLQGKRPDTLSDIIARGRRSNMGVAQVERQQPLEGMGYMLSPADDKMVDAVLRNMNEEEAIRYISSPAAQDMRGVMRWMLGNAIADEADQIRIVQVARAYFNSLENAASQLEPQKMEKAFQSIAKLEDDFMRFMDGGFPTMQGADGGVDMYAPPEVNKFLDELFKHEQVSDTIYRGLRRLRSDDFAKTAEERVAARVRQSPFMQRLVSEGVVTPEQAYGMAGAAEYTPEVAETFRMTRAMPKEMDKVTAWSRSAGMPEKVELPAVPAGKIPDEYGTPSVVNIRQKDVSDYKPIIRRYETDELVKGKGAPLKYKKDEIIAWKDKSGNYYTSQEQPDGSWVPGRRLTRDDPMLDELWYEDTKKTVSDMATRERIHEGNLRKYNRFVNDVFDADPTTAPHSLEEALTTPPKIKTYKKPVRTQGYLGSMDTDDGVSFTFSRNADNTVHVSSSEEGILGEYPNLKEAQRQIKNYVAQRKVGKDTQIYLAWENYNKYRDEVMTRLGYDFDANPDVDNVIKDLIRMEYEASDIMRAAELRRGIPVDYERFYASMHIPEDKTRQGWWGPIFGRNIDKNAEANRAWNPEATFLHQSEPNKASGAMLRTTLPEEVGEQAEAAFTKNRAYKLGGTKRLADTGEAFQGDIARRLAERTQASILTQNKVKEVETMAQLLGDSWIKSGKKWINSRTGQELSDKAINRMPNAWKAMNDKVIYTLSGADAEVLKMVDNAGKGLSAGGISGFSRRYLVPLMTSARPAMIFTNTIGNIDLAMRENAISGGSLKLAYRVRQAMSRNDDEIIEWAGRAMSASQWADELGQQGVMAYETMNGLDPYLAEIMTSKGLSQTPVVGDFLNIMRSINGRSEDFFRSAVYFKALDDGMSPAAASAEVNRVLFDYSIGGLTEAEKRIREWVPFFTFTRRNIPATADFIRRKPGMAYHMYADLPSRLSNPDSETPMQDYFEQLKNSPEYVRNTGFPIFGKLGESEFKVNPRLPIMDIVPALGAAREIAQWDKESMVDETSNALGQYLSPVFKIATSAATGRDPETGLPLQERYGSFGAGVAAQIPTIGNFISAAARQRLFDESGGYKGQDKAVRNAGLNWFMSQLPQPINRTAWDYSNEQAKKFEGSEIIKNWEQAQGKDIPVSETDLDATLDDLLVRGVASGDQNASYLSGQIADAIWRDDLVKKYTGVSSITPEQKWRWIQQLGYKPLAGLPSMSDESIGDRLEIARAEEQGLSELMKLLKQNPYASGVASDPRLYQQIVGNNPTIDWEATRRNLAR